MKILLAYLFLFAFALLLMGANPQSPCQAYGIPESECQKTKINPETGQLWSAHTMQATVNPKVWCDAPPIDGAGAPLACD